MVDLKREGFGLLLKWIRGLAKSEDSTEVPEEPQVLASVDAEAEPMKAYWESDKQNLNEEQRPYLDLFLKDVALERIPDATEEPTKESHYNFDRLSLVYLPEAVKNFNVQGVPETPKTDPGISNNGRDAGVIAGIVVAVISGVIILAALIAVVMYRHYVHRNVTSMNFDNPVYRKTTEDQFALEKNGYAPGSKLYPSTVGEEAQEPLNTPGTNEFV
ncbi:hypothetical protein MSG28_010866 [Choristoneura fumiferana]|uniref:Uncharacterized protein n=1 Tax=Choristoneura fumiferana TaxID=7141 RepID=A0ACC0KPS3_CHOFU|nr:hypothetical protein MSG28_010866 [Choristoneura fumiferana]